MSISTQVAMVTALLVGLVISPVSSLAESTNVTVSVTGEGPTIDAAKQDAIGQALQQTMKQLIVVDRVISGNDVLRDKVMSTMDGYVEHFQETDVRREQNGFRVTATITISSSRIENFIGVPTVVSGVVEGEPIFAEVNRRNAQIAAERLQAQARSEIFDRLMRGFPITDANVKLVNIGLDDKDPNVLNVTLDYSFKPEFRRALESTIHAIGWMECPDLTFGRQGWYGPSIWNMGIQLAGWAGDQVQRCTGPGVPRLTAAQMATPTHNFVDLFCLVDSARGDCVGLAPGDYCAQCQIRKFDSPYFFENMPVVFGRFMDAQGGSANIGTSCIVALAYSGQSVVAGAVKTKWHFTGGVDFTPSRFMIKVPVSSVDLHRAKSFIAVAGLMPGTANGWFWKSQYDGWTSGSGQTITDVLPDSANSNVSGCHVLDQAVRYAAVGGN